ncbi:MAG TPA: hypothetical protein PL001_02355 [Candidatus Kryptobacter bacterium]|nr:hypothetical protein [Candidatus Kryptobacter bacterium]
MDLVVELSRRIITAGRIVTGENRFPIRGRIIAFALSLNVLTVGM